MYNGPFCPKLMFFFFFKKKKKRSISEEHAQKGGEYVHADAFKWILLKAVLDVLRAVNDGTGAVHEIQIVVIGRVSRLIGPPQEEDGRRA